MSSSIFPTLSFLPPNTRHPSQHLTSVAGQRHLPTPVLAARPFRPRPYVAMLALRGLNLTGALLLRLRTLDHSTNTLYGECPSIQVIALDVAVLTVLQQRVLTKKPTVAAVVVAVLGAGCGGPSPSLLGASGHAPRPLPSRQGGWSPRLELLRLEPRFFQFEAQIAESSPALPVCGRLVPLSVHGGLHW